MYFELDLSKSGSNLNISLKVGRRTQIKAFKGLAILYSPANVVSSATINSWNMSMYFNTYHDPNMYKMIDYAPTFGPSFATKCMFGYSRLEYKGEDSLNYVFDLSPLGNYQTMNFHNQNSIEPAGGFFCFGNSTIPNYCG
jgi:hypothetical protein